MLPSPATSVSSSACTCCVKYTRDCDGRNGSVETLSHLRPDLIVTDVKRCHTMWRRRYSATRRLCHHFVLVARIEVRRVARSPTLGCRNHFCASGYESRSDSLCCICCELRDAAATHIGRRYWMLCAIRCRVIRKTLSEDFVVLTHVQHVNRMVHLMSSLRSFCDLHDHAQSTCRMCRAAISGTRLRQRILQTLLVAGARLAVGSRHRKTLSYLTQHVLIACALFIKGWQDASSHVKPAAFTIDMIICSTDVDCLSASR